VKRCGIQGAVRTRGDEGFTLVEVLAAFLVLSLSLSVLYQSFITASLGEARVADQEAAALFAESLLDRIGTDIPLVPGRIQGSFRGMKYHWELTIKSSSLVEGEARSRRGIFPYDVEIKILARDRKKDLLHVETIKLGKR
jgi:general secretion pathway protein I